jgi:hypothetical protein
MAIHAPSQALPMIAKRLALFATLALMACQSQQPEDTSLFPLQTGLRWTYEQTVSHAGKTERDELIVRNAGKVELAGLQTTERINSLGNRYYIARDESGTFRVASRNELADEPQADEVTPVNARRFVLPAKLAIGTKWQVSTKPFLMTQIARWPYEMKYGKSIQMTFEVMGLDEVAKTPAGEFKGCAKLQGTHVMRLLADPTEGYTDHVLRQLEWYCPKVGLVRLERDEPIDGRFYKGGNYKLELLRFSGS